MNLGWDLTDWTHLPETSDWEKDGSSPSRYSNPYLRLPMFPSPTSLLAIHILLVDESKRQSNRLQLKEGGRLGVDRLRWNDGRKDGKDTHRDLLALIVGKWMMGSDPISYWNRWMGPLATEVPRRSKQAEAVRGYDARGWNQREECKDAVGLIELKEGLGVERG